MTRDSKDNKVTTYGIRFNPTNQTDSWAIKPPVKTDSPPGKRGCVKVVGYASQFCADVINSRTFSFNLLQALLALCAASGSVVVKTLRY